MRKSISILLILLQATLLQAQTTKSISLTDKARTSETLPFIEGTDAKDVTVSFFFNEDSNTLTVTLVGTKSLFVFWSDTRYKDVFCHRHLRADRLPFLATGNTADRFRIARSLYKQFPHSRRKHLFHQWIEVEDGQWEALGGIPRPLVNDSVVLTYNIPDKSQRTVTVRLRDVLALDAVEQKGTARHYELSAGADLNMRYRIALRRNPCLGKDDEIAAAEGGLLALQKCYALFKKQYSSGTVTSEEALNTFQEKKESLTIQFPRRKKESACPDIEKSRQQYNLLVDSIAGISVKLDTTPATPMEVEAKNLITQTILANARMLDRSVSRWIASSDDVERADLFQQCRSIVTETTALIGGSRGVTSEEIIAIDLFRKAEHYFYKLCK